MATRTSVSATASSSVAATTGTTTTGTTTTTSTSGGGHGGGGAAPGVGGAGGAAEGGSGATSTGGSDVGGSGGEEAGSGGGGACGPSPRTDCGGICVDISMSNVHCGGCSSPCAPDGPNEEASCAEGVCVRSCSEGFTECGGALGCRDVSSDDQACGPACLACSADLGERCVRGACVLACDTFGLTLCENGAQDYCADLVNDASNCGGCGTVCPGGTCGGGFCESCAFTQPDSVTQPGICAGVGETTGPPFTCPNMEPGMTLQFRFRGDAADACAQQLQWVFVTDPRLVGGTADVPVIDAAPFDFWAEWSRTSGATRRLG